MRWRNRSWSAWDPAGRSADIAESDATRMEQPQRNPESPDRSLNEEGPLRIECVSAIPVKREWAACPRSWTEHDCCSWRRRREEEEKRQRGEGEAAIWTERERWLLLQLPRVRLIDRARSAVASAAAAVVRGMEERASAAAAEADEQRSAGRREGSVERCDGNATVAASARGESDGDTHTQQRTRSCRREHTDREIAAPARKRVRGARWHRARARGA